MPKDLFVCGLSHHKAPLAVRERLAAAHGQRGEELRGMLEGGPMQEGVLLSTCNRVELIAVTAEPHRAREHVLRHFNRRAAPDQVDEYVYEYRGLEAVRHLFRVASGLDSMVLGEPQILGQVKEAYAARDRSRRGFDPARPLLRSHVRRRQARAQRDRGRRRQRQRQLDRRASSRSASSATSPGARSC